MKNINRKPVLLQKDLNNKFNNLPPPSPLVDLDPFVTWEGLESALKGVREALEPKERVVIDMSIQTVSILQCLQQIDTQRKSQINFIFYQN